MLVEIRRDLICEISFARRWGKLINQWSHVEKWEKISKWEKMEEATAKIDEKGRIIIPKTIRKKAKLKPGTYVNVKSKGNLIIIEPSEPIAEKYCGIFQVSKWPEDLDEFVTEATKKWWIRQGT